MEIGSVNIGSPWARDNRKEYAQKPMAPLSYFGTQFRIPFVSILFPPLPIVEYNSQSGRLVLDMSGTNLACIKLNTFQETLVNAIVYHQHGWFKTEYTKDDVKGGFQPIFQDNRLILHCPSQGVGIRGVPMYRVSQGGWRPTFTAAEMTPGLRIRVAVKIHGISFLNNGDVWSGRCRLQHRVLGMIVVE